MYVCARFAFSCDSNPSEGPAFRVNNPAADDLTPAVREDIIDTPSDNVIPGRRRTVDIGQVIPAVLLAVPAHIQMIVWGGQVIPVSVTNGRMSSPETLAVPKAKLDG